MATTRKAAGRPATRKPAPAKARAKATTKTKAKPARKAAARKRLGQAAGEVARLAGVGTDAVARATGRAWDQWLAILDKAGAAALPHKAIAALLAGKYRVPPWWSQMVAVGYEQARGLRKPHQKADGFSASASRTVGAGLDRLYGAWSDPKLRALWLGAAPVKVTRANDGKSLRIAWTAGDSRVEVNFAPVARGRSRVQVEHGRLADEATRAGQKAFWSEALDRLKLMLEKAA
ncbi:MAG: hypothetical protein NDI88_09985 [Lysobacter sp.]|nr:hypothetical protein [Lysobacter sp.]